MIESRIVGGRYLLLDGLDRRGFGLAHRAEDRITGRNVVVTEIRLRDGTGPRERLRERLLAEVRAAGRLRHPGVVPVLDLIADRAPDGALREHLVTERPDARTLTEVLAAGPLPARRVAALGRDVLAAVRAVHEGGGTHGGLDPDCVLVTPDGRALVTDLGLARAVGERPAAPGAAPDAFDPPERRRRPDRASGWPEGDTPAADLWSLGAVLAHAAGDRLARNGALATAIAGLTADAPALRPAPDEVAGLLERAARPRASGGDLGRNRGILLGVAGLLLVAVLLLVVHAIL
ncbi:protein kinase domain-containing protein [Pseudonocardia nantongensis]|uniref:protein kinase domain-containing protein n=1 Tax=Pseudonocardia nantongensis TaxID=1181885 RepID=UPI00397828DC